MANTLGIIKPDGVRRKLVGKIIQKIEQANLVVRGLKVIRLSKDDAQRFYAVHEGKPFFELAFLSVGQCKGYAIWHTFEIAASQALP